MPLPLLPPNRPPADLLNGHHHVEHCQLQLQPLLLLHLLLLVVKEALQMPPSLPLLQQLLLRVAEAEDATRVCLCRQLM